MTESITSTSGDVMLACILLEKDPRNSKVYECYCTPRPVLQTLSLTLHAGWLLQSQKHAYPDLHSAMPTSTANLAKWHQSIRSSGSKALLASAHWSCRFLQQYVAGNTALALRSRCMQLAGGHASQCPGCGLLNEDPRWQKHPAALSSDRRCASLLSSSP